MFIIEMEFKSELMSRANSLSKNWNYMSLIILYYVISLKFKIRSYWINVLLVVSKFESRYIVALSRSSINRIILIYIIELICYFI